MAVFTQCWGCSVQTRMLSMLLLISALIHTHCPQHFLYMPDCCPSTEEYQRDSLGASGLTKFIHVSESDSRRYTDCIPDAGRVWWDLLLQFGWFKCQKSVELCAYIIPNVYNNVQTQRNLNVFKVTVPFILLTVCGNTWCCFVVRRKLVNVTNHTTSTRYHVDIYQSYSHFLFLHCSSSRKHWPRVLQRGNTVLKRL